MTTSLPHRADPVAGVFVASMCRALARRGHRVTAVFIARGGGDGVLPVEGVRLRAVACTGHPFYGAGAPDALYGGARAWVGAARAAWSLWREARAVAGETEAWVSNFIVPCGAIAGAVRGRSPHVAVVHGSDAAMFARLPLAVRARVLAGATRVWCSHAGLVAGLGPTAPPVTVRPMGWWAPPVVAPLSRSAGEGAGVRAPQLVLVVSRLIPLKGVDRVARAVALLRERGRSVSLVVAGDGPERASLARAFPWARWTGAVDPATRDALMARATVLAHAPRALASGRTEARPP
ncbi:MAG: glycosyltransferase [Polyangiales bacterium]